jgi:hypothetical protein
VRRLALRNCEFADELAAALPRSPLLAQLAQLDLSMGTLSDDGAAALAAHADALRRSTCRRGAEARAALRAIGPHVIDDGQRDDDGERRYVSVGE